VYLEVHLNSVESCGAFQKMKKPLGVGIVFHSKDVFTFKNA
jgi:hypothetical protein